MFSSRPDFRSGRPGDLWLWWKAPDDKSVWIYQGSWPSAIKSIQSTLSDVFADIAVEDLPPGCMPYESGWYSDSPVKVDGVLNDNTLRWLMLFLCATGNSTAANLVSKLLLAPSAELTPEIVRYMLWIAYFVTPGQVNLRAPGAKVEEASRLNGGGIYMDPNTIMPSRYTNPGFVSDWWSQSLAYFPVPQPPPSSAETPWPTGLNIPSAIAAGAQGRPPVRSANPSGLSSSSSSSGLLLLLALAAGGYYYLNKDKL